MKTIEFFELVLPEKGVYVLFTQKPNGVGWNENHNSLNELAEAAAGYDKSDATVYYALATFSNNVEADESGRLRAKRKAIYADQFKTLAVDIDIGGKYATAKEAAQDLLASCDKLGLPRPLLVRSGKGVHAYWPMSQAISAKHWEVMARMLRAALASLEVDFDTSKIHDPAMVLRPVGTRHKKDPENWLEVKAGPAVEPTDPRELAKILMPFKGIIPTPARKPKRSSVMDAFFEGDRTPIVVDSLGGCAQIKALLDSQGAKDANGDLPQEPMWRASLGIAKFSDDVEDSIIALAGGHPEFDLEDSKRKLAGWQGTGPTTCQKFDELCPNVCPSCPHYGKFKSPAVLSKGSEVIVAPPTLGEIAPAKQIKLPDGYSVKFGKIVYRGPDDEDDKLVAPFEIWVEGRSANLDQTRALCHTAVKNPDGTVERFDIDMREVAAGAGARLKEALAEKDVYIRSNPRDIQVYLMTYLQEIKAVAERGLFFEHFGWQSDDSFLSGCGVHKLDDDEEVTIEAVQYLNGAAKEYQEYLEPTGEVQPWINATKLFAHPDLTYHGGYFLMMLGAPLMAGSNIAGVFVNAYSPHSGSGKTLTARFGLSAWGKPSKLMRNVNDTDNALYKSLGVTSSFGGYIDEYTIVDPERGRRQIFTLQDGRERTRLGRDADSFREQATWNMPVFASSNRNIHDMLQTHLSAEAEQMRVLQLPFPRTSVFDDNKNLGYELTSMLETNYGIVGPMLVTEIIKRGGAKKVYDAAYKTFSDKYDFEFKGPERFLAAAVICGAAIGEIASDLGLIKFDYKQAMHNVLDAVRQHRDTVADSVYDAFDIIFQYMNDNAGDIVHYRETYDAVKGEANGMVVGDPTRIKDASARVEITYDDQKNPVDGKVFLNRKQLNKFCREHGAELSSVMSQLKDMGVKLVTGRKRMFKNIAGLAGTGGVRTIELDISSHARLIDAASDSAGPLNGFKPRLSVLSNDGSTTDGE